MTVYSIVVPTYNEYENIKELLDNINHECYDIEKEVIFVDDSSPDGTCEYIKHLSHEYYFPITVLERKAKLGIGTAYKYALDYVSGDYVIIMDADLSHDPKYIKDFIMINEYYDDVDIVVGSRYVSDGKVLGWGFHRKMISRIANLLTSLLFGIWNARDMTGSFRLYKLSVLKDITQNVSSSGYAFQMETYVRAKQKGYKVMEYPITFVDRRFGKSKLGISEILKFICSLWKLIGEIWFKQ